MAQTSKATLSSNIDAVHTTSLTASYWGTTTPGGITGDTHAEVLDLLITQLQNLLDSVLNTADDAISQVDAEAGSSTELKLWSAERISQAIAALSPPGSDTLAGLTDTVITSPEDFEVPVYSTGAWRNEIMPRGAEYFPVNASSAGYTLTPIKGFLSYHIFALLDSADSTVNLGDHSAEVGARHILLSNHEDSDFNMIVEAPDGFIEAASGKIPYTVTAGPPESFTLPPGESIFLIRTGGPGEWYCAANSRKRLAGAEIKTLYEAEADTNAFTDAYKGLLDNPIAFEGSLNELTGGVMEPLNMEMAVQYVATHAAPATSGAISVNSSEGKSASSYILYQAASVPTLTGIVDDGVAAAWNGTDINIIIVFEHGDGTYRARHAGIATV